MLGGSDGSGPTIVFHAFLVLPELLLLAFVASGGRLEVPELDEVGGGAPM